MFRSLLIILFLFSSFFIQAKENRTALVIGNSNYQFSPLLNPKNDAEDFTKVLKTLGFTVILKVDANLREMDEAVNEFGRILEKNKGVGLFFYAGHGVQSNGRNYLIPINSDLSRESDLKYNAMDAGKILDEMGYAKNNLNIAILDACRNNPLTRSFRGGKRGLARPDDVPSGILIAYSTAPGKQAADGSGRNSPYTKALLKSIKKEGLPLELVFKNVIKSVKQETHGKQIPWVSSSVDGDFYFSKKNSSQAEPINLVDNINSPINTTEKFEILYWESVVNNPNKNKYRAYLSQYPDGHFKAIAQTELEMLANIKKEAPPPERSISFNFNRCNHFIENYYLTSGPKGDAYSCYNKILKKDPANKEALMGISKIEQIYVKLTKKYLKQQASNKVQININKLEKINPLNESLVGLKKQLELLNKEQLKKNPIAVKKSHLVAVTKKQKKKIKTDKLELSDEQQQIYNEYEGVIKELLSDKQYKKAERYIQKLIEINPQGKNVDKYVAIINTQGAKIRILSTERQHIFDEYVEIVYDILDTKRLSKKDANKIKNYMGKLSRINENATEIRRLRALYEKKLNQVYIYKN